MTFFPLVFTNCLAQNKVIQNLDSKVELKYVLANINLDETKAVSLWNGGQYIKIYKIKDSKATPANEFNGYDGVLESIYISSMPDGDYYTSSALYKIEGLLNPKIIDVKEGDEFKFIISLEHGPAKDRKTASYTFEGIQ